MFLIQRSFPARPPLTSKIGWVLLSVFAVRSSYLHYLLTMNLMSLFFSIRSLGECFKLPVAEGSLTFMERNGVG